MKEENKAFYSKRFITEDLSFLKDYLLLKKISYNKLSKELNVSSSYLRNCVNNKTKMKKNIFNGLLNVLSFSSYEELKEEAIRFINEQMDKSPDLTFFKGFLLKENVSVASFAKELNIPITSFKNAVTKGIKLNNDYLDSILYFFDVKSINELKEKVENNDKNIKEKIIELKRYRVEDDDLKQRIKDNNIKYTDIARRVSLSRNSISCYVNNKYLMSYKMYKKISEEVDNIIKEENDKCNISSFGEVMKINNISQRDLFVSLDMSSYELKRLLSGSKLTSKEEKEKIYYALCDLLYIRYLEVEKKNLLCSKLILESLIDTDNKVKDHITNNKFNSSIVNYNLLFRILKKYDLSPVDKEIIFLFFVSDYSINEIKLVTKHNDDYIIKLISDAYQLYIELYYKEYSHNLKLIRRKKYGKTK